MTIKERLFKIHNLSQQIDKLVDELVNNNLSEKRINEINIEIERLDDEIEILKLENKMKLDKKGS